MNTLYLVLAILALLIALGGTLYAATTRPVSRLSTSVTLLGFALMALAVIEVVRSAKAL